MISFENAPKLVEPTALSTYPGAPFSSEVVEAACDLVRRACGWHIAPAWQTTIPIPHHGGRTLMLPTLHLTEVTSIKDGRTDAVLTGWEGNWSDAGMIERDSPWPYGFRAVKAEVEHGLPSAPADLKAVVAAIASDLRSLLGTSNGQRIADLQSVALDGGAVTYKSAPTVYTDSGGMVAHTRALARYKL